MSDFTGLFEANEYIGPTDVYTYASKDALLALFDADTAGQHLGTIALTVDRHDTDFGDLVNGQPLELEVDSITRELIASQTVNHLVKDWDKENNHDEKVRGRGRLIINESNDEWLLSARTAHFAALHHAHFKALLPAPIFKGDSKVLAVIQIPVFEPKPQLRLL